MTTLTIAGFSPSFISLLLECYARSSSSRESHTIRIVCNVPRDDMSSHIPYARECDTITFEPSSTLRICEACVIGVGQPTTKRSVVDFVTALSPSITFPNIIDPSSHVAETSRMDHGIVILPHVVIGPFASLGRFVTVNRQSSIGHHTRVDDFCTISPGVHIAGHCHIHEGVCLGIGAVVCDGLTIGRGSIVGAGAVVTKSIPEGIVAYGNPARVIRTLSS